MRILTHLNLSQNELQNAVLHKLGQAPANPVVGQIYFNTTDKQAYIYQETGWENLGLSNSLLEKLTNIEDSYYKKFAAMESALSKLQSQTSQLSGLLGS